VRVLSLLERGGHHVATVAATDSAGHIEARVVAHEVTCPALAARSVGACVDWQRSKLEVLLLMTMRMLGRLANQLALQVS